MVGEIQPRQLHDNKLLLRSFGKYIGPNQRISDISTFDLQNYRKKLIRDGTRKSICYDAIGKYFSKLVKTTQIQVKKGVGFHTFRRTAATLAARCGAEVARAC